MHPGFNQVRIQPVIDSTREVDTRKESNKVRDFKSLKILVVGDIMLDRYVQGVVKRISPEAPVPVVQVRRDKNLLGGAANVANNLRTIGVQTHVMGLVGTDEGGKALLKLLEDQDIDTELVDLSPWRTTTIKTRIVAGQQQIVRVDRETTEPLREEETLSLVNQLEESWDKFDGVILSDYGKGLLSQSFLDSVRKIHKSRPKIVSVDPKERSFSKYEGFTVCTPNRLEAETAMGCTLEDEEVLLVEGEKLRRNTGLDKLLVTLGSRGMCLFGEEGHFRIATEAREVFDVTGAGDTVIGVLTASLCAGYDFEASSQIANAAAGIVVGRLGAATIDSNELGEICQKFA